MNQQLLDPTPPTPPRTVDDIGLPLTMIQDIFLRTVYRQSLSRASEMAQAIALPVVVVQELIDFARNERLMEAIGSSMDTGVEELRYQLSDLGKVRARDASVYSQYHGAMPVPLTDFQVQSEKQSIRDMNLTYEKLSAAMDDLILPDGFLRELGPAIVSGRSILMYGPPGNGKSAIAQSIRDAMHDDIFIPCAVAYAGQIITVFDPTIHERVADTEEIRSSLRRSVGFDHRYVKCRRPTVITGGELQLSMLNLTFNSVSNTYQAPLQMKATGGIFIIDDLGRHAESPQALINRWIVPMEANYDILTLQSGEKFIVPFDTLVIFSTNFHPKDLFDSAALRRVFFKLKVDGPTEAEFLDIIALEASAKEIPLDEDSLIYLMTQKYAEADFDYAGYHAPFLVDHILAICKFEGKPPHMSRELIDRAWKNLFIQQSQIAR